VKLLYDDNFTTKLINFILRRQFYYQIDQFYSTHSIFGMHMRVFVMDIRVILIMRTPKLRFKAKLYIQIRHFHPIIEERTKFL
jgi:hypothetical protein